MRTLILATIVLGLFWGVSGCDEGATDADGDVDGDTDGDADVDGDADSDGDMDADGDGGHTTEALVLSFTGLPVLGEGYVYEGWAVTADGPVSTGRFTIDEDGVLDHETFEVDAEIAEGAAHFVLTIEPAEGDDPAPAATHILAGPFEDETATLTVSDAAALGTDFSEAAGSYILATPTTSAVSDDDLQGIWFLVPGEAPSPSLSLPELPAGWSYEGWVVVDGAPISTGRFTSAAGVDSDGAGETAGPDEAPPFPGQDFIDPATVLVGGAAVVSVEPEPDDSPAPFAIKPLLDGEIEAVAPPASQDLGNNAVDLPEGTASFTSM